jgi:hypothetical protein
MALQADSLGDLVAMTLRDLGEMKITEITTDLQDHVAMSKLLMENSVKLESGYGVQWDIMVNHSGAFQFTGLYATDNVNVSDTTIQANVPWRHATTNYAIDERELAMNRSPRKIVDLLKVRRLDAMISQAEGMESAFWGYPLSTDTVTPYGVAYWIVKSATAATSANNDGFNGGAQTGYTQVAGVSPTTYRRWRNYSDIYTAITKDDFVRKVRRAMTHCIFKPVAAGGAADFNTGDKWGMYTTYNVLSRLEELLESQNENLGNDVASKDGEVMFRRVKVKWVPKLDLDTTDPVYGINWGVFKTYILRGWWLKELKIEVTPGQHTVCSVHVDSSLQWICKDRRRNFVVATGTATPSN